MVKNKIFMGTVTTPNIDEELNAFLKELTQNQLIDVKFNTNLANIKKADNTSDLIILSSALVLYEE